MSYTYSFTIALITSVTSSSPMCEPWVWFRLLRASFSRFTYAPSSDADDRVCLACRDRDNESSKMWPPVLVIEDLVLVVIAVAMDINEFLFFCFSFSPLIFSLRWRIKSSCASMSSNTLLASEGNCSKLTKTGLGNTSKNKFMTRTFRKGTMAYETSSR